MSKNLGSSMTLKEKYREDNKKEELII